MNKCVYVYVRVYVRVCVCVRVCVSVCLLSVCLSVCLWCVRQIQSIWVELFLFLRLPVEPLGGGKKIREQIKLV